MFILCTFLSAFLLKSTFGEECYFQCSNVFDYVCGYEKRRDGSTAVIKYQNICHMRRKQCEMENYAVIYQIPQKHCGMNSKSARRSEDSRRVNDFSITGAHQACNHTCPTYCTDQYEPACAQIWTRNMESSSSRPMINHCHIDLFSCSARLNVTIRPLASCYKNPSGLLFMMQVAGMKSLRLLEDNLDHEIVARRSNNDNKKLSLLDSVNLFTVEHDDDA